LIALRASPLAVLLLAALPGVAAERITVDGQLNEPEWAGAQVFTDFRLTEPLNREVPPFRTEARILPRPEGLFFGVRVDHPRDQRIRGRSPRDAETLDADPIIVIVDFEGRGRTAYEFTVSLSGSVRDSVVLNQTQNSRDWDATWFSAVHEDDVGWSAEIQIPWSVAPEGIVNGEKRTIGFFVSRYLKKTSTRYSFPAIELFSPTFVRDFQHIEVPRFKTSSLDVVPYVSVSQSLLDSHTGIRAGADVVWKPNGGARLAATLKPDFGQVESDDLVVNFSAIETFFSDKRPFFTEGQQLFDLRMPLNGRLLNTRRIGGPPDVGPEGATDVLAGAKFTGDNGRSEYGLFTAVEEDSSEAQGRDYLAARWHRKFGVASIGYLGTYARHPTIDRDAEVHSIDFDSIFGRDLILNVQAITTDIHDPALASAPSGNDGRGFGTWATLQYQPGGIWQEALRLTWLDRDFNINDFGYMERASIRQVNSETYRYKRSYPDSSVLATTNWHLNLNLRYNDFNEQLPGNGELGYYWQFKSGDGIYAYYYGESSGIDDLLLRGNGNVRLPARNRLQTEYYKTDSGTFRFTGWVGAFQEGIDGWAWELHVEPKVFLTETLSLGLKLTYDDSSDWLIWTEGTQLGSFARRQVTTEIDGAWYPRPKQELRLKAQWIGLRAAFRQAYNVDSDGEPIPAPDALADFSVSNVAVQLRYRYELGPLSDLYVVYSRGGYQSNETTDAGFASLISDAWNHPSSDEVLVKMRYRF
jgi:hypothetical protein